MHKTFSIYLRSLLGVLALVVVLCFVGPLGWPELDLPSLLLLAVGVCLGVLIILLPRVRP